MSTENALTPEGAGNSRTSLDESIPRLDAVAFLDGKAGWIVVGCVALISVIRFLAIGAADVEMDEVMHIDVASQPSISSTLSAAREHAHPPLVFAFYHYWVKMGTSEPMLRFPSLVFGAIAIWGLYLWLKELLGPVEAMCGALFVCISPAFGYLSTVMRGYTLLLACLTMSMYFTEWFLKSRQRRELLIGTGFLSCAILTHYSAFWIVPVQFLRVVCEFLRSRDRAGVAAWLCSQLVIAILCGWLLVERMNYFFDEPTAKAAVQGWLRHAYFDPSRQTLFGFVAGNTRELAHFLTGSATGILFLIPVCVLGAVSILRRREAAYGVALYLMIPFVVAVLAAIVRLYPFTGTRHSAYLIPFMAAIVGSACRWFLKPTRVVALCLFSILVVIPWCSTRLIRETRAGQIGSRANVLAALEFLDEASKPRDWLIADRATAFRLTYYFDYRGEPRVHLPEVDPNVEFDWGRYRLYVPRTIRIRGPQVPHCLSTASSMIDDDAIDSVWLVSIARGDIARFADLGKHVPPDDILAAHRWGNVFVIKLALPKPESPRRVAKSWRADRDAHPRRVTRR